MRSRLERRCLAGALLLATAWSAVRNLRAVPVTFDEDEVTYYDLAEVVAGHFAHLQLGPGLAALSNTYRPPLTAFGDALVLLVLPPDRPCWP